MEGFVTGGCCATFTKESSIKTATEIADLVGVDFADYKSASEESSTNSATDSKDKDCSNCRGNCGCCSNFLTAVLNADIEQESLKRYSNLISSEKPDFKDFTF